ncbi:unnamed protein product, partial [Rotaria sp. Silwood1]
MNDCSNLDVDYAFDVDETTLTEEDENYDDDNQDHSCDSEISDGENNAINTITTEYT